MIVILQHHANLGGPRHFVEVRIDEGDGGGQHPAGQRRDCDLDRLAGAQPGEVGLVGIEHEPHRGKVGDFKKPGFLFSLVLVELLAFVDMTGDDGAGYRGANVDHGGGLQSVLENVDLLVRKAEIEQPFAGGGPARRR